MTGNEIRIGHGQLHRFATEVFKKANMRSEDAAFVADALVWANLRGVDSHGVIRIPWYVENIDKGVMNPRPNIKLMKETPATLVIDADHALGAPITIYTLNLVMAKAKKLGIGWGIIRNHTHHGALGYYAQIVAEQNMAGIIFACSLPNMAPYGAKAAGVQNSPIAIAVPANHHSPLVLDMATSVVAGGKFWLAAEKGLPLPVGWAIDKEGKPATNPKEPYVLLPFGGAKGSGLAMMLECLSSVLADNPMLSPTLLGREIETPATDKKLKVIGDRPAHITRVRHILNSAVIAINIEMFTSVEGYKEHIDNLIDGIKALPKAEGFDEILVPGERGAKSFLDRSQNGIPLTDSTFRNLKSIAERFSIELPQGF